MEWKFVLVERVDVGVRIAEVDRSQGIRSKLVSVSDSESAMLKSQTGCPLAAAVQ
jgi:hypothetical protein